MDAVQRSPVEPTDQVYDGFISYSHAADDLLAPRLQSALQRFAKPWWKRRAVRIFRDESSLSANPHLWSSITEALDTSGWFVLLLSPDAARSEWVNQEIAYWVSNRDARKILPVVTDGSFGWAEGDVSGDAVPNALRGVFQEEPRWVDVRWAEDEDQLDLKDPRFADAIADIASTIRGVPKDDLASEEVRQHRRTVRTAWATGGLITVLAISAVGFAVQSAANAAEAERQAEIAEANAAEAESNAKEANAQRNAAEDEAERADNQAAIARSRELAASAVNTLQSDPELSILLAIQSIEAAPAGEGSSFESLVALRTATHATKVISRVNVGDNDCFLEAAHRCRLSPDGSRFVSTSGDSQTVRMLEPTDWDELWVYDTQREVIGVQFSQDGSQLAVGYYAINESTDDQAQSIVEPASIEVLDSSTGDLVLRRSFEGCLRADVLAQSPDSTAWAVALPSEIGCSDGVDTDDGRVILLDSSSLGVDGGFDIEFEVFVATWLPDGERMVVSGGETGPHLLDVASGQVLAEGSGSDFWNHAISPDGSLVAAAKLTDSAVWLFETESMTQRDLLTGLPDAVEDIAFSGDGSWVMAGSAGDGVIVWDVGSGEPEHSLTTTGPGWTLGFDDERRLLYVAGPRGAVSVWDLSGSREGEIDTVDIDSWVQSNSIVGTRSRAAFTSFRFPDFDAVVRSFRPGSGEITASIDVNLYWGPAILPDNRIVVMPEPSDAEVGPVVVWNPDDGSQVPLVGCRAFIGDAGQVASVEDGEATCIDGSDDWLPVVGLWVDPAGERLLISTADGEMLTFDARTLEPLSRAFFDDGSSGVEGFGGDWIVFSDVATNVLIGTTTTSIVDTESFEVIAELPGGVPELDEEASRLALYAGPGEIAIYDTATWQLLTTLRAGESRIRGLEFSPDGSMLASGAVDGFLRIWDVEAGVELHRIPIESPSDAYWIDDEHLVVGTQWGLWTTITLDTDELIEIALDRLTRGFTNEECATYRIDPCPTLDETRSR